MKNRGYLRNAVLACIALWLAALQLSAGTVEMQPAQRAVVAGHYASPRVPLDRRSSVKQLVPALPVLAVYRPAMTVSGNLVSIRAPRVLVRNAATCSTRAPPLS